MDTITTDRELLDSLQKRECVPFVGAGVSHPMYPSWDELLASLAERFISDSGEKESFTNLLKTGEYDIAAQHLFDQAGRQTILREMISIFLTTKPCSDNHSYLVSLDYPGIVTTNYDCLIEQAFAEEKQTYLQTKLSSSRVRHARKDQRRTSAERFCRVFLRSIVSKVPSRT